MKSRVFVLSLVVAGTMGALTGCASHRNMLEDPTVQLAYLKNPSAETIDPLSKAYASTINHNRKKNIKYPGLYCDYAVTMAKLGNQAEANKYFNMEIEAFPASRDYVNKMKSMVDPLYVPEEQAAEKKKNMDVPTDTTITPAMREAVDNVINEALAEETNATVVKEKKTGESGNKAKKSSKSKKGKKGKKGKKR